MTVEQDRLRSADAAAWRRWGPYLAERAWGTVREDYSPDGKPWEYFPHDHARSRVYRWNEDGLAGICDHRQRLCFALALWNGRDPILKERLFGLNGNEGNHGEDVKEYYFYLDSTPTHSFMRACYKYPQAAFPYDQLIDENRKRGKADPEFELIDTGVFADNRYFDVFIEYAKADPNDILIRLRAINRGPSPAALTLVPTLWFRNTWAWDSSSKSKPGLSAAPPAQGVASIIAHDDSLGDFVLHCEQANVLLFTENETNRARLYKTSNTALFVKDAFHEYVVQGNRAAVNAARQGTKAAALYSRTLAAGAEWSVRLRLTAAGNPSGDAGPFRDYDRVFAQRERESDEFYAAIQPKTLGEDLRRIQRQAFAGMLWSKQFYCYDVSRWLDGDPTQPAPPVERKRGPNHEWRHLNNADIISMPDKWEYPWYASWDLAFHCVTLALVDAEFAKRQLVLLGREWYQHPNGQIPAYEWNFSDANPPVLAWAAWRVYKIDKKMNGSEDRVFLERVFHKLLLYFTWWVNRKDSEGNNIFQGGFLGLDNIGVLDRSKPLPTGGFIEQSDGTSWMAMFCLNMMTIALELAYQDHVYEDIATKFFEHLLYIAAAMNNIAGEGISLWDETDEFFYDALHLPDGSHIPLKIRSVVGLIPLFAVETIEPAMLDRVPGFKARLEWFLNYRPDLAKLVSRWHEPGMGDRRLIALTRGHRLKCLLKRALDPNEFLSDYGIRGMSRFHEQHPFVLSVNGMALGCEYEPAESRSGLFGGNSNWRGPVWFPINYLLIESLQKFHHYYSDDFKIECPTGSGKYLTLLEIADELSQRLIRIFARDANGKRAFNGGNDYFQQDAQWRDYCFFYEYFHGNHGAGLGASHQTGWTGLVAKLIQQQADKMGDPD